MKKVEKKSFFFKKAIDKQRNIWYNIYRCEAVLCNGSTTDSDSVCWGSNPYTAETEKHPTLGAFLLTPIFDVSACTPNLSVSEADFFIFPIDNIRLMC